MNYKLLFLLVEGDDDERFFQRIVKTKFEEKYNTVMLWKYAQVKNIKVDSFLKSIKQMGADYIYVADINLTPCITDKKQKIQNKFNNIDIDRIIVVIKEIESWYLAGLDDASLKELKISFSGITNNVTNNITKEQFNNLIPKRFDYKIDFMSEILKRFSIETAKQKNTSFRYFLGKHNCEG